MSADPNVTALRELLAIVDIDAGPALAVLSLAQRELPRALTICDGNLTQARFRFGAAWRLELAHCGARLDSRSINRQALRQHKLAPALIQGFIGDSARPRFAGESDPYIDVLRLDLDEVSVLLNPHNQACLMTAPDHLLIDGLLPDDSPPDWPRTPAPRPSFLRLSTPADLPHGLDASALRSLELSGGVFAGLRELLMTATELRHLCLHDPGLLSSGIFDGLKMRVLEQLELPDAAQLSVDGWSRVQSWDGIRLLRIHGMGLAQDNFDVLALIGRAPFWKALRELDLMLFTRYATLDEELWGELWSDQVFALQTLRLRYLDSAQWSAVWRGHFPRLKSLGLADNGLRDHFREALAGAALPQLESLDLRGNNLSPQALREFALNHGFASLKRIGVQIASEQMEDYCDWNGAVVGSGPVPLRAAEIEATWLAGTGLRVFDD